MITATKLPSITTLPHTSVKAAPIDSSAPPEGQDRVQLDSSPGKIWGSVRSFARGASARVGVPALFAMGLGASGGAVASLVPHGFGGALMLGFGSFMLGGLLEVLPEKAAAVAAGAAIVAGMGAASALFGAGIATSAVCAGGLLAAHCALAWGMKAGKATALPRPENPLKREETLAAIEGKGMKLYKTGFFGTPVQLSRTQALKDLNADLPVYWAADPASAADVANSISRYSRGSSTSKWNAHLLDDQNRGLAHFAATGLTEGLDEKRKAVAEQVARLRAGGYTIPDKSALALIQSRTPDIRDESGLPVSASVQGPTGYHQIKSTAQLMKLDPSGHGAKEPLLRSMENLYASGASVQGQATPMEAYLSCNGLKDMGPVLGPGGDLILPSSNRFDAFSVIEGVNNYGGEAVRTAWHGVQSSTVHGYPMASKDAMGALLKRLTEVKATPAEFEKATQAACEALKLHFSSGRAYITCEQVVGTVVGRSVAQERGLE